MLAQKARFFGDTRARSAIISSADRCEQNEISSQIVGFDSQVWTECRYRVAVEGNLAKFSQDATRRQALLDTHDRILVDANPSDRVWGIGFSAMQEEAYESSNWGQNLTGRALMEARDLLCSAKP